MFIILTNYNSVFEAVDIFVFLSHTSCMKKVLKRILWILSTVFFSWSLDQPSCLTTAFLKTLSFCVFSVYAYQRQTGSDRSGKGLSKRTAKTKD